MHFQEFSRLGLNWLTVSSAILVTLVLFQSKALYNQARSIWRERSGESVSLDYFLYMVFFNGFAVPYGLEIGSLAIFLTGFTAIFFIWIVTGLWKFESPTKVHYFVLVLGMIAVLLFPVVPLRALYAAAMIGTLIPIFSQARELHKRKDPGVLEISYFCVLEIKTAVWMVYVVELEDLLLQIYVTTVLLMLGVIIGLWTHYHPERLGALKHQILSLLPFSQRIRGAT